MLYPFGVKRDARSFSAPKRLGEYEIVRPLAAGGMAELYLARATGVAGFEKLVALKRIRPELARNQDIVRLFLQETRIAATLDHPNIVQVYDVGIADDSYFLAMELVRGEDLRNLLAAAHDAGQPIPLGEAIHIILGVCAGLHYAHEKRDHDGTPLGIVHRDVSPSNVLVGYDGAVKVLDFGIAKAARLSAETSGVALRGKYSYMSPEQCQSAPLDRRSDVFSIGILLYEVTTGVRLFEADGEFLVMKRIVEVPAPPPSSRRPGYPAELERIVCRGLERNRERRYATADAMRVDLQAFAEKHRLLITPSQLAQFMKATFARRNQTSALGGPDSSTGTEPLRAVGAGPLAQKAAAERADRIASERSGPDSRRRAVLVVGGALLVALVAVGGLRFYLRHPRSASPAAAPPAQEIALPPQTTPPALATAPPLPASSSVSRSPPARSAGVSKRHLQRPVRRAPKKTAQPNRKPAAPSVSPGLPSDWDPEGPWLRKP